MPRRIPDFPDSYAGWNLVSSFGSLVSVIATLLFAYIIFDIFALEKETSRRRRDIITTTTSISAGSGYAHAATEIKNNPWAIPSYFDDAMKFSLIETFKQLEWTVASPAPEHCITSKPKQS